MNSNIINTKSNNDYKNSPDPTLYRLISQVVSDLLKKEQNAINNIQNQIFSISNSSINQAKNLIVPTGANDITSVIDTNESTKLVLTTDGQLPSNLSIEISNESLYISPDGNLAASVNIKIDDIIDIVDYEVKYIAVN